ncbi:fibroblast growth factor, partial [Salmonella sp. s51228]|uniref:fibroblast growth factor n=1 Tax=Salmonella sp. s51228 TaxID=3159652 RepID=UPI0039815842
KQISFQSIAETPLCIGVSSDGSIADPKAVQPGHHFSQFNATLISEGLGTARGINSGTAPGIPVAYALKDQNIIQLISRCSGRPLHIAKNGLVTASGGYDELSELKVLEKAPGIIMLQSASMFSFYFAMHNDEFIGRGQGGEFCQLKIIPNEENYATFESVKCPGSFLGVNQHGA